MSEYENIFNQNFERNLNLSIYDSLNISPQNEMTPNINYYPLDFTSPSTNNNNEEFENQQNLIQTPVMNINVNNNISQDNNGNEIIQTEIKSSTGDSSKNPNISILPRIENIVSTATLGCQLNLREIALRVKNAEYNPRRFSAVIMRIKEPKTTALIFSSGKIVTLGAKSEEESRKACRKFAKIIKSLNYPVSFKDFKIQNIVGSVDSKFKIALFKLYIYLIKHINCNDKSFVSYEPEHFPGLIYRMIEPNIVILIFYSGKLVLTGAKTKDDIYNGFRKIYPLLVKFKSVKNF